MWIQSHAYKNITFTKSQLYMYVYAEQENYRNRRKMKMKRKLCSALISVTVLFMFASKRKKSSQFSKCVSLILKWSVPITNKQIEIHQRNEKYGERVHIHRCGWIWFAYNVPLLSINFEISLDRSKKENHRFV